MIDSVFLVVNPIGRGLVLVRGRLPKRTVNQVDRLLSNCGIEFDALFLRWIRYVVGRRPAIVVAMDWTNFDAGNQSKIISSLIGSHDRSTPLVWLPVDKTTLKSPRNAHEYRVLVGRRGAADRRQRADRGGSRVWRSETVSRSQRRVETRLSDTVSRQCRGDLCRR